MTQPDLTRPDLTQPAAPPAAATDASRRPALVSPGIRAMAIGAFWFSIMGLLVKISGRTLGSMQIVLTRGLITLALSWWALKRAGVVPWGNNRRLLFLRGVLGSMSLMCFVSSLLSLPLGEAMLIQNMNPVFATLAASVLLKEHLRPPEVLCLAASLFGVLFIAHPASLFGTAAPPTDPLHLAVALTGALCAGTAYVLVRKMRGTEHPFVVVFYLPLLSVPTSLPFALAQWRWPTMAEWALLAAVGVTTQLAQVSMTRGLQLERTARATTIGYLQVAFAVLWGAVVLGEIPDVWTLVGAVTIIGSTLVLSWWNSTVAVAEPAA